MSTSPLPLHGGSTVPTVATPAAPPMGADMGFGPAFAQPETGVDWRRVLSAVARFKWLIAVVTILGTVGGLAATRFIKPQYMVQATLWIDQPDQRGGQDRGPIRAGQPLEPEAWLDLLQSYRVLDQVVRDQRLYLAPKAREDAPLFETFHVADQYRPGAYRLALDGSGKTFTLSTDKGVEVERGAVGDSIGARLGFGWAPAAGTIPAGRTIEFSVATVRDSARALSEQLEVATDPAGNFLRMHLKGADAARITSTINAIADRFVLVAADLRRQKLTELTKILDQQLAAAHQNLLDAEQALEKFQVKTITLPSMAASGSRPAGVPTAGAGSDDPAFKNFFSMQVDRQQVQQDREALQRVLAQAGDSGVSPEALAIVGAVQQNVDLKNALKYHGPTSVADYAQVHAAVSVNPQSPIDQSLTITAGTNDGVRVGSVVVDPSSQALVGIVDRAFASVSRVTLLTDNLSNVTASDLTTPSAVGIVRRGGGGSDVLILDLVSKQKVVNVGDTVITAGSLGKGQLPSMFPHGIPIGTVSSQSINEINPYMNIQVHPFADLSSLQSVIVLVPPKR